MLCHFIIVVWIVIKVSSCDGCEANAVRLVGGESELEGRVEVCGTDNIWRTVCDDYWDDRDASVVCRQLGFSPQGSCPIVNAYFGQGSGEIIKNVACNGSELRLSDCRRPTPNFVSCSHSEDAGVRCQGYTVSLVGTNITSATSVLVSWFSNPVPSKYSIFMTRPLNNSRNVGTITEVPGHVTEFEFEDLLPQQNYRVCVIGFFGQQLTPPSCRNIRTTTLPDPTSHPPGPTFESTSVPSHPASALPSHPCTTTPLSDSTSHLPGPTFESTSVPTSVSPDSTSSVPSSPAPAVETANCSLLGGVLGSIIALLVLLLIVAGVGLAYPHCIRSRVKKRPLDLTSNVSCTDCPQHSSGDGAGFYVSPTYEAVPDPPRGPRTGDTADQQYEVLEPTPGEPRHGPAISQVTADIVAQHYEMYEATYPEHSAEPAVYEVVNEEGDSKQPAGDYSRLQYQ